jgi:hypothetical protein
VSEGHGHPLVSQECKESRDAYRLLVVELIKNEFKKEKKRIINNVSFL